MMNNRHLQVTKSEDVLVVRFLDRSLAGDLPDQLGEELRGVADQENCTRLLLNFSGVDFLTIDMLGKVLQLNKRMQQRGGKLTLCEVCSYVRDILVVTKLDSIIAVKDTESDGLRACA